MTPDGEPINNPEAAKRAEIDRVKGLIKKDNLIFRGHDIDNPGENDLDGKEEELIRSFGLEKVETVQQMFDAINDPNRNHDIPKEKLDVLATAVCESIIDAGRKEIVVAGSVSVEKQLMWTGFEGKNKKSENSPSFAFMVAEKFRERIGAGERRDAITSAMEYLDFVKNNEDYSKGNGLAEAVAQTRIDLARVKPNVLNKGEMQAYADVRRYVNDLVENGVRDRSNGKRILVENPSEDDEDDDSQSFDYEAPVFNKDKNEWEGGSRWELSPEFAAEAMKYMDYAMRWQSYTPPEWFKNLDVELQAKIEYMVMVNSGASHLRYAGKDLDKVLGNESIFNFTHEQLNKLFDSDFKFIVSRMLHDLCEIGDQTTDQNGIQCLRYKEKFYEFDYSANRGEGSFVRVNGRLHEIPETLENMKRGIRTIDQDVLDKLGDIMGYKDQLAYFLSDFKQKEADDRAIANGVAKRNETGVWKIYSEDTKDESRSHKKGDFVIDKNGNMVPVEVQKGVWEVYKKDKGSHKKGDFVIDKETGKRIPGYLTKMNAYTAWNFLFAMGDSSLLDRKRVLPTYQGIISDAVRTLNPEYKARSKWQVEKSGKVRHLSEKDFLLESEYFGGPMGQYVLRVAKLERDLGRPLDSQKTVGQKIYDGELQIFPDKTVYGFFDFFNTSRDLEFADKSVNDTDTGTSFAKLIYDYGIADAEKGFVKSSEPEFRFRKGSTTFQNEFFDSYTAAVDLNKAVMGKVEVKNPADYATMVKTAFGMMNGVTIGKGENAVRPFGYTRSPELWRAVIIGGLKPDFRRLSSDYIPVNRPGNSSTYDSYVYKLITKTMALSSSEVNLYKLMNLLGVYIKPGEDINSFVRTVKGDNYEKAEIKRTRGLLLEADTKLQTTKLGTDVNDLLERFYRVRDKSFNEDFVRMGIDFQRVLDFGDLSYARNIVSAMERF